MILNVLNHNLNVSGVEPRRRVRKPVLINGGSRVIHE
jgi:hypothetical protein